MASNPIFILTGAREGGKTTLLKKVIALLKKENIPLKGFYAEGYYNHNQRSRFELVEVNNGRNHLLCYRDPVSGDGFCFVDKTLAIGKQLLQPQKEAAVYVIDEIGRYELEGHIWHHPLQYLIHEEQNLLLITVRNSFLDQVVSLFGLKGAEIFHTDHPPKEIANKIKAFFSEIK